ncbi:MAG: replicative DNA helicase [Candidatus Kapaibacteriales bacterium]
MLSYNPEYKKNVMSANPNYFNFKQEESEKKQNSPIIGRIPPNSREVEIAVLGAMMISKQALNKAENLIFADVFYYPSHKYIYEAMSSLSAQSKPVDLITISEELKRKGILEKAGGYSTIAGINSDTPSANNVEQHCFILLEKYLKRMMIDTASGMLENAFDETKDALDEIDEAESKIFELAEKRFRKSYRSIKELSFETYGKIEEAINNKGKTLGGVNSGIAELDKLTGGFQNSDLIIIAARPSMGKTALALTFLKNATLKYKKNVAFFSLEMADEQIVKRLVSSHAFVPLQNLRTGEISTAEQKRIVDAFGDISSANIYIDDAMALTVNELRAKCRRLKAEKNIDMILIDYLQLMNVPGMEQNREREIAIISQSLKQLAKELEVPVISLAQINRAVEGRQRKIPMLSDLRESGSIEQDADIVMFVNRAEYYDIERYEDGTPTENTAELIIAKQRNGPVGHVRCAFRKEYAIFENLDQFNSRPTNISDDTDF